MRQVAEIEIGVLAAARNQVRPADDRLGFQGLRQCLWHGFRLDDGGNCNFKILFDNGYDLAFFGLEVKRTLVFPFDFAWDFQNKFHGLLVPPCREAFRHANLLRTAAHEQHVAYSAYRYKTSAAARRFGGSYWKARVPRLAHWRP